MMQMSRAILMKKLVLLPVSVKSSLTVVLFLLMMLVVIMRLAPSPPPFPTNVDGLSFSLTGCGPQGIPTEEKVVRKHLGEGTTCLGCGLFSELRGAEA